MFTWLQSMPTWVGAVGWLAVLVGFFMQRKALINVVNKNSFRGDNNVVTNITHQGTPSQSGGGDSALSQWESWASVVGLGLTLLPLLKEWLGKTA